MRHNWTPEDDVIAFYLYRCESKSDVRGIPFSFAQIVAKRGMPVSSLRRRIDNFEFLDTGKPKGASHYAPHKSKPVYEQYKNASCDSLRSEVIRILGR